MRVLLLSVGGPRLPGVRHRAGCWVDALGSREHAVKTIFPFTAGPATHVLGRPLRALDLLRAVSQARVADVVIVYRTTFPLGSARLLRRAAHRLLFDFDDAIYLPSPSEVQRRASETRYRRNFATTVARMDLVTAGNDTLAREVRGPRVEIVPTPIDTNLFRPAERLVRTGLGCVVGWIGTAENLPEWERLVPAFRALAARLPAVRFKVICSRPPGETDLPLRFERWSQQREAEHLVDVDVGIMPLADTPWNRGKCAFKALQAMAMGLPVVASAVGMNAEVVVHGRNGFLVEREADWIDALARLGSNEGLRRRMGREARATVEERYAATLIGPRMAELVESIAAPVGTR